MDNETDLLAECFKVALLKWIIVREDHVLYTSLNDYCLGWMLAHNEEAKERHAKFEALQAAQSAALEQIRQATLALEELGVAVEKKLAELNR